MIRENKAGLYFNEMGDNLKFPGILWKPTRANINCLLSNVYLLFHYLEKMLCGKSEKISFAS